MTPAETVEQIVNLYKKAQPGPASLENGGVTNAESLRRQSGDCLEDQAQTVVQERRDRDSLSHQRRG